MTRQEALRTLIAMRDELQREYKTLQALGQTYKSPDDERSPRLSELLMTLSQHSMRISALTVAISLLEDAVWQ